MFIWVPHKCEHYIERKLQMYHETKQAKIMKDLYSMRSTGRFPTIEVEEESLWLEVSNLILNAVLFGETPIKKVKLFIFQDWDKMTLAYRLGGDDKSLVRQFALQYSPNRVTEMKHRAERNGYRTKYSPPDSQYKAGLLEIEVDM